jgi:hypothetical protein
MGKAFRAEAVVDLPRVSNNEGQGSFRLAQGVKYFQVIDPFAALLSVCRLAIRKVR